MELSDFRTRSITSVTLATVVFVISMSDPVWQQLCIVSVAFCCCGELVYTVWSRINMLAKFSIDRVSFQFYVCMLLISVWAWASSAIFLISGPRGARLLWVQVVAVSLGDIAAYGFGRAVGGAKLWRSVSPNKTWSGAIGGTIVTIGALALGIRVLMDAEYQISWLRLCVLSGLSLAGDLFESRFKRIAGIDNTSNLLPGHGGVMDRLDSHLWSATYWAVSHNCWFL